MPLSPRLAAADLPASQHDGRYHSTDRPEDGRQPLEPAAATAPPPPLAAAGHDAGHAAGWLAHRDAFNLRIVLLLVMWYTSSASIIFVSKWMLSGRFPFPLTVTTCSNLVVGFWASAAACGRRSMKLRRSTGVVAGAAVEPVHDAVLSPPSSSGPNIMLYIWPIAACTALEIGCSNAALRVLTVSFGTILKGSAPVFVLLWGFALRVERFSWQLLLVVMLISGGIGISAVGESDFHVGGFLLQIIAVSFGGLRWALIHILLKGRDIKLTPLRATLYTAPLTSLFVAPIAVLLEAKHLRSHLTGTAHGEGLRTCLVLLLIGSMVFVLLLLEYTLVRDTSSLAVSIASVFKELVTIFGGVLIFRDVMSLLNWLGFAVAHVGIALYIQLRQGKRSATPGASEEADSELDMRAELGSVGAAQTPLLAANA